MANTYTVLNGGELLAEITNAAGTALVNDGPSNSLSAEGVNGTRRLILDLTGFNDADHISNDAIVQVWVKLPEPIVIDSAGVSDPKQNDALPVALISPRLVGATYGDAQLAVSLNEPVTAAGVTAPGVAGETCEYAYVVVGAGTVLTNPDVAALTLSLDFPHSLTR